MAEPVQILLTVTKKLNTDKLKVIIWFNIFLSLNFDKQFYVYYLTYLVRRYYNNVNNTPLFHNCKQTYLILYISYTYVVYVSLHVGDREFLRIIKFTYKCITNIGHSLYLY